MVSLHLATVILLSIVVRTEAQNELSCGQRPIEIVSRMTNAYIAQNWPGHAVIYHRRVNDSVEEYQCGGTVITATSVLTAGHCVWIEWNRVSVSLGRHSLNPNNTWAQHFEVARIDVHPDYYFDDLRNDIAIIRLATEASFNNHVRPVCLWNSNLPDVANRVGTVIGFGLTENDTISMELREVAMPVVSVFTCLDSYRDYFGRYLNETNFCAGSRNGTSVCTGDSGGSMTFQESGSYYIRGIVSTAPTFVNPRNKVRFDALCIIHGRGQICNMDYRDGRYRDRRYRRDHRNGRDSRNVMREDGSVPRGHGSRKYYVCEISLDIKLSERKCKIIHSVPSNGSVTRLIIEGELEAIPDLSDAANKFENMNTLDLGSTKLKIVERENFAAFGRLERLYLHNNSVTEIAAHTFDDLKKLMVLRLESNELKQIHADIFAELRSLTTVSLENNKLEVIPEGLFRNNIRLEKFVIENNKIKEIHRDLFKELGSLHRVTLSGNKLEILPEGLFRNNRQLERIFLSYNKIKAIHRNLFKGLGSLRNINLNGNELEILPESLFQNNVRLEYILLQNNEIKEIETDFQNLRSLRLLNLEGNVCIDEKCDSKTFCGTNSRSAMQTKLRTKCPWKNV